MPHKRMPKLIGFCGTAGAGKTTAAAIIVGHYPGYNRISFADPLRDMLLALGLTIQDLTIGKETPHRLLGGQTPRRAMQTLGTEWGRGLDAKIWQRIASWRAMNLLGNGQCVVFDDVRFDNEAELIHDLGGVVVHLTRYGHAYASTHASELGVSEKLWDFRLHAGDMPALQTAVFSWLNRFEKTAA